MPDHIILTSAYTCKSVVHTEYPFSPCNSLSSNFRKGLVRQEGKLQMNHRRFFQLQCLLTGSHFGDRGLLPRIRNDSGTRFVVLTGKYRTR